ncbi:MAG: hypothetical protein JJU03_10910 [Idiomarina sp.]|nr:hypothetical protein [Idiomarina sp.]
MSTLLSYLSQFTDIAQPRVHSYATHVHSTLTFKAVAKQAQALRQQYSEIAGARVAVTLTANSDALTLLVALDGYVGELILLPVDHPVPVGCHFHLTERGHLRTLSDFTADNLPVVTQWGLLDERHELITYTLDELATNELVMTGSHEHPLRWGVMQEPAELAGLLVWLRALKNGEDIVLAQADSLKSLADMFSHAQVSAIAAPTRLWRNLLAGADVSRLELELAIVNGGLVDEPTLQRIRNIFSDALVAHSFSHTGAGMSWLVTDGKPGLPPVLFAEADNQVVLAVNQGRLDIAFTGSGATIHTDYLVEQGDDGRVMLVGHQQSIVSVGGREVNPEQVEVALMAVPGVMDVQASSMPDPVLGELIRVDVLAPGHRSVAERKVFKQALQDHCREVLEPWQRPARYYFHG